MQFTRIRGVFSHAGIVHLNGQGRRTRPLLAAWLVGALILPQAPSAWAQGDSHKQQKATTAAVKPDLATAKKHYIDGRLKFRGGDFTGALADFQVANDIKVTAQAERYIGRCLDALGRYQEAAEWYEKFLAHAPAKMAALSDKTRTRLEEIRTAAAKTHRDGSSSTIEIKPPSASLNADDDSTGPEPGPAAAAPASPTTPAASPEATSPGEPAAAATELPDTPPPASSAPSRLPAFMAAGGAIVAAGIGTTFGVIALSDKAAYNQNMSADNANNRNTHALIADVSFGAAVSLAALSAVLFLTSGKGGDDTSSAVPTTRVARANRDFAPAITPTPFVSAHGGGATLLMRF